MEFTRAFSYAFEDKQWTEKLVITAIMAFLSIIPLIGLVAVAALLGFVIEIVQNVRDNHPHPLPKWDKMGDKIAHGGNVLVAWIVYNIPNLLVTCCIFTIPGFLGSSDLFQGGFSIAVICCLVPFLLIYNLITWPMLALGTVRYADTGAITAFFQFGDLFTTLRSNLSLMVQWVAFSLLASFIMGFFNAIPCLGSIVALALIFPVQGHLLGQFAALIDEKPKRKMKRAGSY